MKPKVFQRFWAEDIGLTGLMVILFVETFAIYPFVDSDVGSLVMHFVFIIVLITGVMAVSRTPHWARLIAFIAVIGLGFRYWGHVYPHSTLLIANLSIRAVLASMLIAVILMHVFRKSGPITHHRIAGSIAVYLLIGALFGYLYFIVCILDPGAFNLDISTLKDDPHKLMARLVYFSYITMTSVGFGDVTPISPVACTLSMAQALIGQLFPAILLARLVSLEIEDSHKRRKTQETDE